MAESSAAWARWKKPILLVGGFSALVVVLLWAAGGLGGGKVAPGTVDCVSTAPPSGRPVAIEMVEVEDFLEWPGTVRSRTEVRPAAKLMARVLEVRVRAGDAVRAGDVLAVLDDRDVKARAEQARSALHAEEAQAAQARAEHDRVKGLFEREAATRRDLEAAEARARSAAAQAAQAGEALREAEVALGEAQVRAPAEGVVAEKLVEAGDTAVPGRALFVLHDPSRLRLEALVPETCAAKLSVGMKVRVRMDVPPAEVEASVEEISPAADPRSRTFQVKASLPAGAGFRAGTFGRFLQPCGKRKVLLVPAAAVRRYGQIEMVRILQERRSVARHVKTGKAYGNRLEVLSGLREGETVVVEGERP